MFTQGVLITNSQQFGIAAIIIVLSFIPFSIVSNYYYNDGYSKCERTVSY